jgi:hypothetical protein
VTVRIVMPVQKHDGEGSAAFTVSESFDECLDHVAPISPPSSALEHRQNCIFTDAESGDRIYIDPRHVAYMEENPA